MNDLDPERIVQDLREGIKMFAQGMPPSDDITIVALRFKGAAGRPAGAS